MSIQPVPSDLKASAKETDAIKHTLAGKPVKRTTKRPLNADDDGKEKLGFSLALDLMFNGQNMDYVDRPISLSAFDKMAFFDNLHKGDRVAVIGPGGGRLVKTLAERGFCVEAFEGRDECVDHLNDMFGKNPNVTIRDYAELFDPEERNGMCYKAMFNMDDLRAFRDNESWTDEIGGIVSNYGYFVYSQVSNKLPKRRNNLADHFKLVGNYNVSQETADQIRASYFGIEQWDPDSEEYQTAKEALKMVESATSFRRNILSGVEIRYFVWKKRRPINLKAIPAQ